MSTTDQLDGTESPGIEQLRQIAGKDRVSFTTDTERVEGVVTRIERGLEEIRIEIAPFDVDAPQYQIRSIRKADGWSEPTAYWISEAIHPCWRRCGRLEHIEWHSRGDRLDDE